MERIICIGDLCADLIIPYGEARKAISSGNRSEERSAVVELRHGGTVGNTVTVLGKLGAAPIFITDLCDDALGRFLRESMEGYGADMSYSPIGEYGAMVCPAVIDENGERTMFSWVPPGARFPTFSGDSFSEELYSMNAILFTGGMTLTDDSDSVSSVIDFIRKMKEKARSVFVFDLNARIETYGLDEKRRKFYREFVGLSDILLGSGEDELCPIAEEEDLMGAAKALSGHGKRTVIARNGAEPIMIVNGDRISYVDTERVDVVSTIGAGDSFNAGFLFAYDKGLSIEDCVRFGNHTAAYVISHEGQLSVEERAFDDFFKSL